MRVDLKGIHPAHVKLADGTKKIYYYAWRGGPRLRGQPGSPDFIASYNEAIALRVPTPDGHLQNLLDGYQRSQNFLQKRERTRRDYIRQIKIIEAEFGDFPLKALSAKQSRGVFKDWRDRLALKSVRQADYAWTVLDRQAGADTGARAVESCTRCGGEEIADHLAQLAGSGLDI